jgi:hypothetical protein
VAFVFTSWVLIPVLSSAPSRSDEAAPPKPSTAASGAPAAPAPGGDAER